MRAFTPKQNQLEQQATFNRTRSSILASAESYQGQSILNLQRAIGNQAVGRTLQTCAEEPEADSTSATASRFAHDFSRTPTHASVAGAIQAKLSVNAPGDIYEQEADAVAENIMRTVHPPQARRQIEEEKLIQRKTTGNVQAQTAPSIVYHVLRSPGQPLDVSTREFMETRFGHDFSRVRVHTDPRAADSARALDALAYTVGRDVVFGAGQYTKGSNESRKLIAHELTHVIQQGFTSQAIQRQPANKPKKKATTNPKSIYEQIKKRNPDLAELITPQSIDFSNPKAPPDIKGGPMKDGEEHHWKVRVLAGQGFANSQTVTGSEARKKAPGGLIVTHFIDITWALPLAADQEFIKQPISEDEAFTLTAAESLYHELLHARIIMERDPRWTSQHTQVFQGYANILQIAGSAAVDKERQELKGRIGALASGGGTATTPADLTKAEDLYYEFLVHEKYDADTESKPFGRTFPNALIAEKYSKVVAMRLRAGDRALHVLTDQLAASAEKLFNKLDQATQTGIPSAPSGDSPATKQPKK